MQNGSASSHLRLALTLFGLALSTASCGDDAPSSTADTASNPAALSRQMGSIKAGGTISAAPGGDVTYDIHSMTDGTPDSPTYFSDPYPINFLTSDTTSAQYFSGTNPLILRCAVPISPGCFKSSSFSMTYAKQINDDIKNAGVRVTNEQNYDIYQDDQGYWHMVFAIGVTNQDNAFHWTVIVHAHPVGSQSPGTIPTTWIADNELVGRFDDQQPGNYSPKLFRDGSGLFLLYVKRRSKINATDPNRNDIVAQKMIDPGHTDGSAPVTLLKPGGSADGYNSELFDIVHDENDFRVVEVNNVTKIGNKYALAYSVGRYDEANYKTAVAWSDTFLPSAGATYRKVVKPDPTGIWNNPGAPEILYLLQSQKMAWSNYTGKQVMAPGVPSIVQSGGKWFLYFGGYDPQTQTKASDPGVYLGSLRQPYYLPLNVTIPSTRVVDATDADLATWITPATR